MVDGDQKLNEGEMSMKSSRGFTLVELIIVVAIIGIIGMVLSGALWNNRGATEKRAYDGAKKFVAENSIDVKRLTCAGDSDGDGYGSCTIVTKNEEHIMILCPTNFTDVNFFGATSCKEQFQNYGVVGQPMK